MGIEIKRLIRCDHCKKSQADIIAEHDGVKLPKGVFFDKHGVEDAYGWLALNPQHLSVSGMGHNELPRDVIVLCDRCRIEFKNWL